MKLNLYFLLVISIVLFYFQLLFYFVFRLRRRLSDCKEDCKKTWSSINELRGKSKQKIKPLFTIYNKKITNRRVIANKFNSYFVSIASKLNSTISETPLTDQSLPSFYDLFNPPNNNSIVM